MAWLNGVAKYCRAQKQVVAFFLKKFNQEQTFVFSVPTQHAGVKMQEKPFVHPPTPTSSCSVCSAEEGYLTEKRLNICASCTTGNFVPPAPRLKRKLIIITLTWLCWQGCVQYCILHSSQGVVRTTCMFHIVPCQRFMYLFYHFFFLPILAAHFSRHNIRQIFNPQKTMYAFHKAAYLQHKCVLHCFISFHLLWFHFISFRL